MENELIGKVSKEDLEARRNGFGSLFDSQIATLKDRGCPEQIVDMLSNHRSTVLSRASEMIFEEGHVPFLPVIPTTYRMIYDQMSMARNAGKEGYTCLEPDRVSNVVDTPARPYYIFDVEDGEAMRGKSPQDAEKVIASQHRHGLTEVEVIALGVHTDVLSRHYMDAVGSRYASDIVPSLWLRDGRPILLWNYRGHANSLWGAASCGSRLGLGS